MSQVSGLRTLLRWAFDESPVGWMFSKHESPPIFGISTVNSVAFGQQTREWAAESSELNLNTIHLVNPGKSTPQTKPRPMIHPRDYQRANCGYSGMTETNGC